MIGRDGPARFNFGRFAAHLWAKEAAMHVKWSVRSAVLAGIVALAAGVFSAARPVEAQYDYPDDCYDIQYVDALTIYNGKALHVKVEISRNLKESCVIAPDNRVNSADGNPAAAIYCQSDGVAIWDVDTLSRGEFLFLVPYNKIAAVPSNPDANKMIAEHGGFRLYRLTSGELQLNSPPDWQGKEYVFTWSGCSAPAQ